MIVKRKGAQQKFTYNVCNTFALKEIVDLESSLTSNNTCYKVGNKSMPIPSTINYCVCEKPNFLRVLKVNCFMVQFILLPVI